MGIHTKILMMLISIGALAAVNMRKPESETQLQIYIYLMQIIPGNKRLKKRLLTKPDIDIFRFDKIKNHRKLWFLSKAAILMRENTFFRKTILLAQCRPRPFRKVFRPKRGLKL